MEIKIKLLENGILPFKAHLEDACFDCYARESRVIKSGETMIVPLGFKLELPLLYEAQMRGRSGLSKKGIKIDFGTIDANYRGEVCASVYNTTSTDYKVAKGDRICQMAICPILKIDFNQVDEISESERGENGFGSTGK